VNPPAPPTENDHTELVRYGFVFDVSDLGTDPAPAQREGLLQGPILNPYALDA
jgi:hypothetical protein